MDKSKGNIYLRDNSWYKRENVIKMGIDSFVKDRNNTYITGEVERGEYICVIEIPLDKMKFIDKSLITLNHIIFIKAEELNFTIDTLLI